MAAPGDLLLKSWKKPWGQTQWVLIWIIALCGVGILLLVQFGIVSRAALPGFLTWAFLSSLASFLAGSLLGMLFGLPSVPVLAPASASAAGAAGAGATAGSDAAGGAVQPGPPTRSGYAESTSLEQVADWLTKIIVGLTLTQFGTWADRFRSLSTDLTAGLLCPQAPGGCGTVPGGALMSAFALSGFLFAYLWMRRFFIREMVTRDDEVSDILRRQLQAKAENRVQMASGDDSLASRLSNRLSAAFGRNLVAPTEVRDASGLDPAVAAIIADGAAKAQGGAGPIAHGIRPGEDPDDPWRGAFGGSPTNKRALLSATVTAIPNQPSNFEIAVSVQGISPDDQKALASRTVLFYLHPTFGHEVKTCTFGVDGRATLTLYGYGAFTIGALLEDGSLLELNLAELPGIPSAFRNG